MFTKEQLESFGVRRYNDDIVEFDVTWIDADHYKMFNGKEMKEYSVTDKNRSMFGDHPAKIYIAMPFSEMLRETPALK